MGHLDHAINGSVTDAQTLDTWDAENRAWNGPYGGDESFPLIQRGNLSNQLHDISERL